MSQWAILRVMSMKVAPKTKVQKFFDKTSFTEEVYHWVDYKTIGSGKREVCQLSQTRTRVEFALEATSAITRAYVYLHLKNHQPYSNTCWLVFDITLKNPPWLFSDIRAKFLNLSL